MRQQRIQAAIRRSNDLLEVPWGPAPETAHAPRRCFAIGDPQTSRERFFAVLAHHDLLGDDGMLAPDEMLISMGDHFDYDGEPAEVGREGLAILRWLAEHPSEQAPILAGNHDVCRVMELAPLGDEDFAEARVMAAALEVARRRGEDVTARERIFFERFPPLPSPGVAVRDFLSYAEPQRTLVQALLLAGRMTLAVAAQLPDGREVLLTHAAVTRRELALLEPVSESPRDIAVALNEMLAMAVREIRPHWEAGEYFRPLSLAPVHIAGTAGQEGGGLLYHRPANPERLHADHAWEFHPVRPRRFDPRTLPLGLVQVCGHTGHRKCVRELGDWVGSSAREMKQGGIRTLCADTHRVSYEYGLVEAHADLAVVYMIDATMHATAPATYPLFRLGAPG
ncbi:metallophosphoesterase family protein [Haliangium sp.]|uniref:metallophosphoesterase family protein n=1 Tax=Haliangium sp. TaxID=2663208 RepID=UPI003D0E5B5C